MQINITTKKNDKQNLLNNPIMANDNKTIEVKTYNRIQDRVEAIHYDGSKESLEVCKKFIEGHYEIGVANTIRLVTSKGRNFVLKGNVIVKDSSGAFKVYRKEEFEKKFELGLTLEESNEESSEIEGDTELNEPEQK